jgi:hypothetical protein
MMPTCEHERRREWTIVNRAVLLLLCTTSREYAASLPQTEKLLALASERIAQGRGQELMPREVGDTLFITHTTHTTTH